MNRLERRHEKLMEIVSTCEQSGSKEFSVSQCPWKGAVSIGNEHHYESHGKKLNQSGFEISPLFLATKAESKQYSILTNHALSTTYLKLIQK